MKSTSALAWSDRRCSRSAVLIGVIAWPGAFYLHAVEIVSDPTVMS